jgi:hypothetical protein
MSDIFNTLVVEPWPVATKLMVYYYYCYVRGVRMRLPSSTAIYED